MLQANLIEKTTVISRAGAWFLYSGIQERRGGVARYRHSDTGRNARISTEITGYAASALVYLYRRQGDREFLEAAIRAGHFLTRTSWDDTLGTIPFEHGGGEPLGYFFDCGIIVRGLLHLWRETRDPEFLGVARGIGDAMHRDFVRGDVIHPVVQLPSMHPPPHEQRWSRNPGCYQAKAAMGWLELFEATGEIRFERWYDHAIRLALQTRESFLPGETPDKTMDRLHAYSYFLEALLPVQGRAECRGALQEGIERVSGYLRSIAPEFERSDVYAQLLRLRLLSGVHLNEREASEEAEALATFQTEDGSFCFGRKDGDLMPFANPVSTAFCMQAHDWWQLKLAGDSLPSWHSLI